MIAPVQALSADYNFGSGADTGSTFGKATGYDDVVPSNPITENIRKNKDAAYFPPSNGVFGGDIPSDATSLYHNNAPQYAGTAANTASTANEGVSGSNILTSDNIDTFGGLSPSNLTTSLQNNTALPSGLLTATSVTAALNTSPWYYDDGSIGTLYITKLKKTIKVYEGETLENMKRGIGHFAFTSAWDGMVGFAGHNRGAAAYFGFVKDLSVGDTIKYTTMYGSRTYKIYAKNKISETDFSSLEWSDENILNLITCVENTPDLRYSVCAREVS
jgi:sortase A